MRVRLDVGPDSPYKNRSVLISFRRVKLAAAILEAADAGSLEFPGRAVNVLLDRKSVV